MATSKLPVDFCPVPSRIIELAQTNQNIFCNLRPDQRPDDRKPEREFWSNGENDAYWMDQPVLDFFKGRVRRTHLLVHFQGFSSEIRGTAIIRVDNFFFCSEDNYPRLDFSPCAKMGEHFPLANWWGAFVLAVAEVPGPYQDLSRWYFNDHAGQWFCDLASRAVVPPEHPKLADVPVGDIFLDGYGGTPYRRVSPTYMKNGAAYSYPSNHSVARNLEIGNLAYGFPPTPETMERRIIIPKG